LFPDAFRWWHLQTNFLLSGHCLTQFFFKNISMKTKTDFKIDIKTDIEYLKLLYKKKAHLKPVATHYNSERGTSKIHNLMYKLEKQGFVLVNHKSVDSDVLFEIELTIQAVELIHSRRINKTILIVSILALAASIIVPFVV